VTTDYVVTEILNLANARGGKLVATRVPDLLEQSAGIRVEWIGVERFTRTKAFFAGTWIATIRSLIAPASS
jgi:predicted nucleic acid-binding protein